jgi:SnoaL-like domain
MGAWGGYERGWMDIRSRYDWAAARFRTSGAKVQPEYLVTVVSGDTAYTVAIERSVVRLVDQDTPAPMALRVTHVFRKEPDGWKLVLRHADPLTEKTAPATVLKSANGKWLAYTFEPLGTLRGLRAALRRPRRALETIGRRRWPAEMAC